MAGVGRQSEDQALLLPLQADEGPRREDAVKAQGEGVLAGLAGGLGHGPAVRRQQNAAGQGEGAVIVQCAVPLAGAGHDHRAAGHDGVSVGI